MSSKDLVNYCNFRSVQISSRCLYAQVACFVFRISIYRACNIMMSWTVDWVDEFLSDVESNTIERGADEMKLLLGRKASYEQANPRHHEPCPGYMPPCDYPFYSHLVQSRGFNRGFKLWFLHLL